MPPKENVYIITKVDQSKVDFTPKTKIKFAKMPELYLKLLINKKKVDHKLAEEKYIHKYEPVVSSEESFKPIPRITSQVPVPKKGTFMWESSDSMEPSPIKHKRIVSSSPLVVSTDNNRNYKKAKKSITQSYYRTLEQPVEQPLPRHEYNERRRNGDEKSEKLPSVDELKKMYGGENKANIINIENCEKEKDEDDMKRELLFKFHRLKKTYPRVDIPEFNMMSNHENMKQTYESTVKNLAIDSTVESYKQYLMMGFMGCEIVLGKIGFDMEGYCQQQTLYMNKYEKLLIELGEKSYVPSSINKWPVEIRLMVLVLFQTTIFIVGKIIAKKTNVNALQIYNNVNGVYSAQAAPKASSSFGPGRESGFASGGSSPLTFIPKKPNTPTTSENRMRGPSAN